MSTVTVIWVSGYYRPDIFFHTHPDSAGKSENSSRDMANASADGITSVAIDNNGNMYCSKGGE